MSLVKLLRSYAGVDDVEERKKWPDFDHNSEEWRYKNWHPTDTYIDLLKRLQSGKALDIREELQDLLLKLIDFHQDNTLKRCGLKGKWDHIYEESERTAEKMLDKKNEVSGLMDQAQEELDRKKEERLKTFWYVFFCEPIDFDWGLIREVSDVVHEMRVKRDFCEDGNEKSYWEYYLKTINRDFKIALELGKKVGWEGDFREGHEPRIFWLPDPNNMRFQHGFAWKQDNNGNTLIVSQINLGWVWDVAHNIGLYEAKVKCCEDNIEYKEYDEKEYKCIR